MVFIDVGLLGLLVGKLLGGSLRALGETRIRSTWLAFAAVALQVAAFPSGVLPWSTPSSVARALWLLSYGLLILMLVRNRKVPGVQVIAAGLACNLAAILANGGLMPVRPAALRAAGRSYDVHNNSIDLAHPHLAALVDRWGAPHWLPLANVFSVGDVLIGLGTMIAIVIAMRAEPGGAAAHDRAGEAPPAIVSGG